MEVNGVAHVFITAGDFGVPATSIAGCYPSSASSRSWTRRTYYCVGGRTGFGVRAASAGHSGERFEQGAVGLHHVCFRVREREEVDEATPSWARSGRRSFIRRRTTSGPPATIRCCSRILTGCGWRSTTYRARACCAPGGSGHMGGAWPELRPWSRTAKESAPHRYRRNLRALFRGFQRRRRLRAPAGQDGAGERQPPLHPADPEHSSAAFRRRIRARQRVRPEPGGQHLYAGPADRHERQRLFAKGDRQSRHGRGALHQHRCSPATPSMARARCWPSASRRAVRARASSPSAPSAATRRRGRLPLQTRHADPRPAARRSRTGSGPTDGCDASAETIARVPRSAAGRPLPPGRKAGPTASACVCRIMAVAGWPSNWRAWTPSPARRSSTSNQF